MGKVPMTPDESHFQVAKMLKVFLKKPFSLAQKVLRPARNRISRPPKCGTVAQWKQDSLYPRVSWTLKNHNFRRPKCGTVADMKPVTLEWRISRQGCNRTFRPPKWWKVAMYLWAEGLQIRLYHQNFELAPSSSNVM